MTEYNGWTNRATWLVPLWADNDYGTYSRKRDTLKHMDEVVTGERAELLAALLFAGRSTPDHEPGDWETVNWDEIAESWEAERQEILAE